MRARGGAQVAVRTSDIKGAGTDANVYLTIFGEAVSHLVARPLAASLGAPAGLPWPFVTTWCVRGCPPSCVQDGKALNSGPLKLENSANNFERGQTDIFQCTATVRALPAHAPHPACLRCPPSCAHTTGRRACRMLFACGHLQVGELKYIKIGHDNTGMGPSWHLQARAGRAVPRLNPRRSPYRHPRLQPCDALLLPSPSHALGSCRIHARSVLASPTT